MSSALIFIFVLSILVVVHEYGHFLVARWVGIRVEKFSIGFGPKVFGRRFGETEFCVSLLPLGGFVKLAGENPEEAKGEAWEFNSKSLLQKFAVVFAGPFMNAFLALVLFFGVFWVGQPVLTTKIGKVMGAAPAEVAGIHEGDRVVKVNGEKVLYWEDLLARVHKNEQKLNMTIERQGVLQDFVVFPRIQKKLSFIGIAPANEIHYVKNGFFKAIGLAAKRVWTLTAMIFVSLGLMVSGAVPFKDFVTGPIGIFFMTREAAQIGTLYLFYFMGSLSVSLFVLNLLPIPVLDGGHVLFIVIERLKGSPLKESVKEKMTQVGMSLLLVLMAFVIFQDIHRFSIVENILKIFK